MSDVSTDTGPLPVFKGGVLQGNLTSIQGQPPQQPQPDGGSGAFALAPQSPLAAMGPPPTPTAGPPPQYSLNAPPMPQQPQLQQNKEPPPDQKEYQKDAMAWASAFAVLGAVAGRFTRAPGGAALAAFGAAVKGWQTGNLQAYETASKEWEEKNKQALENNKTVLEQYKLALENRRMNIDEQMQQIQLTAANYHDKMMYDAAAAKNYTLVAQIYEKNIEFTEKGGEAAAKLAGKRRVEEAKQAVTGERVASGQIDPDGLNPQTGQPYSEKEKLYFKYTKEQYLNGFYGTPGGAKGGVSGIRLSQRNEIISSLTQSLGRRPTEDEISDEMAAQTSKMAEARAVGVRAGGIGLAVDESDRTIPNVRALAQRVAGKGYATWNAVENRWNVEKGDRDFAKYVQQMNSLINIYGRVISGGGKGTVSDLEHARQMLNPNMPLSAVEGALDGFSTEIEIAKEAPERVRAKMRGGGKGETTTPTFNDRFGGGTAPASNDGWTVKEK